MKLFGDENKEINEDLIPLIDEMLMELSTEKLEVCLVPGNVSEAVDDGKMIRVAVSQNPKWYRDLCESYPCTRYKKRSDRKDYTKIKRQGVILVLENMIKNKKSKSMYAQFLLDYAKDRKKLYDRLAEAENPENKPWDNQF